MNVNGFTVKTEPDPGSYQAIETVDAVSGQTITVIVCDGHSSTVTNASGTIRGPFKTVREAIQCAHDWSQEPTKPPLSEKKE